MVDIDSSSVRRGILALINIATPTVIGAVTGQSQAVLIAAVAGILFSFSDNDGTLVRRLRLLGMVALSLALGGLFGHLARPYPVVLWIVFPLAAFAVGLLNRAGREPLMAGRFGVIAFAVVAGIPSIEITEIAYLFGAFVLAAVARSIDHLLFGPLRRAAATPASQTPQGRWGWARFSLAYAAAAAAALWIGMRLDPGREVWVVTTTLVVMMPDARASYRRIVQRILGTFLGVIAAFALSQVLHAPLLICAAIALMAALLPHHIPHRYWLHTALIAAVILLAYDLVERDAAGMERLFVERLQDMLVGCAIALVGTAVAFARRDDGDDEAAPVQDSPVQQGP